MAVFLLPRHHGETPYGQEGEGRRLGFRAQGRALVRQVQGRRRLLAARLPQGQERSLQGPAGSVGGAGQGHPARRRQGYGRGVPRLVARIGEGYGQLPYLAQPRGDSTASPETGHRGQEADPAFAPRRATTTKPQAEGGSVV